MPLPARPASACRPGVGRSTRAVFAAVTGRPYAHAATSRDAALDTLRAFVTVMVVAHHSVIAYALISPAAAPRSSLHPWLAGIPIVDSHRLAVFDLFALFNDTFFMSLMFLLSGLFVGPSLARKGGGSFLRDRALRLGAPFVVIALMAPLAYYPAYRAWAANPGALAFWREWLSLGSGRAARCGSSRRCSGSTSSRLRCTDSPLI